MFFCVRAPVGLVLSILRRREKERGRDKTRASCCCLANSAVRSSPDPNAILICSRGGRALTVPSLCRLPPSVSGRRQTCEAENVLFSRTSWSGLTCAGIGWREDRHSLPSAVLCDPRPRPLNYSRRRPPLERIAPCPCAGRSAGSGSGTILPAE